MKTLVVSVAVLALSLPIMAVAQDATKQNDNQTQQNQANAKNNKNMSGKVSSDGKTFTNDVDSKKYRVNNPSALQDYEDKHVAVIVAVDPDTGDLHIIQVEVPQQ
jgi:pectin methylesterase-like acyl-CoA thioesterase